MKSRFGLLVLSLLLISSFVSAVVVNEGESVTIQDKESNDCILTLTEVYSTSEAEISIDGKMVTIGEEYYEDLSGIKLFVNDIFYTTKEAGLSAINVNDLQIVYEDKASNGEYAFFGADNEEHSFDMKVISKNKASLIIDGESTTFEEGQYGAIQEASFHVTDIFYTTKEAGISAISIGFFEGGITEGKKKNQGYCESSGYYCVENLFSCIENGGNVLDPEKFSCEEGNICCTLNPSPNTEECTDPDGLNYYTKGTTFGIHWTQLEGWVHMTKTDYCWQKSSSKPANTGDYVIDFNCQTNPKPFAGKENQYPKDEKIMVGSIYRCPNGCSDGACVEATKEIPTYNKESDVVSSEQVGENIFVCGECELEDKCYPLGYRKSGSYCSENSEFMQQLNSDESCENNFECESNVCVSGQCVSGSLLQKVIEWFKKLFG